MDSTNSGSIQSSSSGDNEEYDSRGESISSFLNLPPPQPSHPPPPTASATVLHHHIPSSSSIFDPLSPYFNPFPFPSQPDSNSLGLDSTWPRGIQPSPSSSSSSSYSTCTTTLGPMTATRSLASASASVQPQLVQADRSAAGAGAPRGPKKRSRASRRAPTTVLNTDTSNFRAMVQQFTGFPTPPFASSSPFPRPRLDLFGMGSAAAAAAVPAYLLRPSAQKIPAAASPFAAMTSSSSASSLFDQTIASVARSTLANMNIPMTAAAATSSSSSTTPSSSGKCPLSLFDAQHPNTVLDHMQTTNFISQSLLQSQSSPQYNSHSLPTFRAQPQEPADFTMGNFGSLIAVEGGSKLNERTDVLSGWMDDQSGGQESTEHARSKAVVRNYGNQR